jgi:DNA-binding MarR family transcriptional regulator
VLQVTLRSGSATTSPDDGRLEARPDDGQPALDDRVLDALDRLAQGRRAFAQQVATERGLTPLQIDVLLVLVDGAGVEPLAGHVARHLDVRASTVADALAALRRKGLVGDRAEGRRRILWPTSAGRAAARAISRERRSMRAALGSLGPEDKGAALDVLLTLIGHLHDRGVISVDRSCLTCRFRVERNHEPSPYCNLLDRPLRPVDLRVVCPEHQSRSAET